MSNNYLCLLGAIDSLWFHQTILFPEPISLLGAKSTETPQDSTANSSFTYPTSSMVSLAVADGEVSDFSTMLEPENPSPGTPDSPEISTPQDDERKRPTRLDIVANRLRYIRSQSSSPISNDQRSPRKNRTSGLLSRKLEKSMSLRSLGELELEELKGLMDLGFTFKKENLNPRMMSLVPGLQRLGVGSHSSNKKIRNSSDNDDEVEEVAARDDDDGVDDDVEVEVEVARPYLSEAWLIKRPDSPLLNLRLPNRVSSASDMKKHLKSWARTVASEIQQES